MGTPNDQKPKDGEVKVVNSVDNELVGDYNNCLFVEAKQQNLTITKGTYQKKAADDTLEAERINYDLKTGKKLVSISMTDQTDDEVKKIVQKSVDEAFLNDYLSKDEANAFKKAILAYQKYEKGTGTKEEVVGRFKAVLAIADKENLAEPPVPAPQKPSRGR